MILTPNTPVPQNGKILDVIRTIVIATYQGKESALAFMKLRVFMAKRMNVFYGDKTSIHIALVHSPPKDKKLAP